jgi:AcrR family transcriptional regulator
MSADSLSTASDQPGSVHDESPAAASSGAQTSGNGTVRAARPRLRPGEGALLREEILAAAEALLDEAGDESALTLRAVAARTGVTTPAVYRHFSDKSALIAAVCMRVWEALGRAVREAIAAEDDPFQGLRRGAVAFMRFGLDHPVHYRLLMMGAPRPGDPRPEQEAAMACLRYVTEAVEPCVEAGVLRGDPEQIALRSLAILHGAVALVIAHPYFPWPEDPDEFLELVARMSGLGSAGLGWLTSAQRTSAPSTGEYVTAFRAFADELRES